MVDYDQYGHASFVGLLHSILTYGLNMQDMVLNYECGRGETVNYSTTLLGQEHQVNFDQVTKAELVNSMIDM
jgi:uncharacterized membrane-anchored protein